MQTRELGNIGESLALSWLEKHNYKHIESNFTRRLGEIDLIMQHPDALTVVFVEVRFRSGFHFGGALHSVTPHKQRKLKRTALLWLQKHAASTTPARIDVIALHPVTTETPAEKRWQGFQLDWVINAVED